MSKGGHGVSRAISGNRSSGSGLSLTVKHAQNVATSTPSQVESVALRHILEHEKALLEASLRPSFGTQAGYLSTPPSNNLNVNALDAARTNPLAVLSFDNEDIDAVQHDSILDAVA